MRRTRWIDHIPPWLAFGAIVSTGVYEPGELVLMAAPLLAAGLAEGRQWALGRLQRAFELLAVAALLGLVAARIGLVPTTVIMLFLLCGIRLCLPRDLKQRRQLLLMGFLIWITTAISTFEFSFLVWAVLWTAGAALVLMQQAWEGPASLRGGLLQPAPASRIPGWTLGALLLSGVFFVSLPRITLGLRAFPWGVAGLTASQAGVSDYLELGGDGPIAPNHELVLRILPPNGEADRWGRALALLRGLALESLEGQRWSPQEDTPPTRFERISTPTGLPPGWGALDCFVAPSPSGLLPLPYGRLALVQPEGMPVQQGPGGSLRWRYPSRRTLPLQLGLEPRDGPNEPAPAGQRRVLLTDTGEGTESADRYSRTEVPGELPPQALAERLTASLRTFRYTLSNPSGGARNPLQDFLERTRAGHCEYFASALALMLRYRNIPARVVNGYRLGPWIAEGGYWLVTQNEAHSWVEYYDTTAGAWRVADPTPPAPPGALGVDTFWAAFQRWTDALRFRWDRHVVRFSDQDQVAGVSWLRTKLAELPAWRPGRELLNPALWAAGIGLAAWAAWRFRPWPKAGSPRRQVQGLRQLKPLLRAVGPRFQPGTSETARQWLLRLSFRVPERAGFLARVADEADAVAYGDGNPHRLKALARLEAKAWRKIGTW